MKDPYEKYRAEGIEPIRRVGDSPSPTPPEPEEEDTPAFMAYLLLMFHRFLDSFKRTSPTGLSEPAEQEVRDHLLAMKDALEMLQTEDLSQDTHFLNQLPTLWHKILADTLKFRKQSPLAKELKAWIYSIDHYPEGQEFTFGYYLTELAGQQWIPLPYMEMIKKVHDAHMSDPASSPLSQWTHKIEDLLEHLGI
jgi:hypothetical protein